MKSTCISPRRRLFCYNSFLLWADGCSSDGYCIDSFAAVLLGTTLFSYFCFFFVFASPQCQNAHTNREPSDMWDGECGAECAASAKTRWKACCWLAKNTIKFDWFHMTVNFEIMDIRRIHWIRFEFFFAFSFERETGPLPLHMPGNRKFLIKNVKQVFRFPIFSPAHFSLLGFGYYFFCFVNSLHGQSWK